MFLLLGMTPQRRPFAYPQNLAKTEDHDMLIAKYRQENDLPVLDFDEDQVHTFQFFVQFT